MTKEKKYFELTEEDKLRYEQMIANIDLNLKDELLREIPGKLHAILREEGLTDYELSLIADVTKLYTLLKTVPNLDEGLQRKIIFALDYFYRSNDEIPDSVPKIGYLDDAVVVRWVVDQTMSEYSHNFEA